MRRRKSTQVKVVVIGEPGSFYARVVDARTRNTIWKTSNRRLASAARSLGIAFARRHGYKPKAAKRIKKRWF